MEQRSMYESSTRQHEDVEAAGPCTGKAEDYGQPRFDADVWQWLDPPVDRSKHFDQQWKELDMQMERRGVYDHDEYNKRWDARR